MQTVSAFTRLKSFEVEAVRSRRSAFRHDRAETWIRANSALSMAAWPLSVVNASRRSIAKRTELKTTTDFVLFKLSHPDFDWQAVRKAIERQKAGLVMSEEERVRHKERAQRDADLISNGFQSNVSEPVAAIDPEMRAYFSSLTGARRFEILAEYQDRFLERGNFVEGAEPRRAVREALEKDYAAWRAGPVRSFMQALEALRVSLVSQTPGDLLIAFRKFGAETYEKRHRNASHRKRAEVLAICIAAADAGPSGSGSYQMNGSLYDLVANLYSWYLADQ